MEERDGAATKMVIVDKNVFSFAVGEVGALKLEDGGVVEDFLHERGVMFLAGVVGCGVLVME